MRCMLQTTQIMSPSIPLCCLTALQCPWLGASQYEGFKSAANFAFLRRRLPLAAALTAEAHAAGEHPVESHLGLLHMLILLSTGCTLLNTSSQLVFLSLASAVPQ